VNVVVTGIGGFIGSHVARRFLSEGHAVVGVDDFSTGHRDNVPDSAELVTGDLAEPSTLAALPRQCDVVLHLAGQSSGEVSFDDPVADLRKNVVSTLNLIRYAIERGARRIVYASSMSAYGTVPDAPVAEDARSTPLSCYGVGKLAAEGYLRVYARQLPFVALRMFNVYGPGQDMQNLRQGMVSIFVAQALSGGRVHVKGSLERFRDFVYIDDVVEAWFRAAVTPAAANHVINVGTGVRTTVGALLQAIRDELPATQWYVEGSTPGDQSGIYADTTKMRATLGLGATTDLAAGLRRFVDWARARERSTGRAEERSS
jgi:UDP-glucose 4-epimerase